MADPGGNDTRVWRDIRNLADRLDRTVVRVGVVGELALQTHGDSGLTNAEIAVFHEFGAPRANIPERSFVRSTLRIRRDELVRVQAAATRAILARRMTVEQALGLVGAWLSGAMRETIARYGPFLMRPLALRTVQAKGSDAPLVDTGQLVNSISFVVLRAA